MSPVDPPIQKQIDDLQASLTKANLDVSNLQKAVDNANATIRLRDDTISKQQAQVVNLTRQNQDLSKALDTSNAAVKDRDDTIARQQAQLTDLTQKNLELTKALEDARQARPALPVEDLARQLRTSLENLNEEVTKKAQEGRPPVMIDNLEVEIKGGVDFTDGVRLTQIPGQELKPESVSTIRFTLKPLTTIKIVDET